MTEASIALTGVLILAVLGVAKTALDYFNRELFPQLKTLADNINDLKTGHALSQQQIEQNTARLNGQSTKIDTLLLTATAPSAPAASPVFTPPVIVAIPATAVPEAAAPPAVAAPATADETPDKTELQDKTEAQDKSSFGQALLGLIGGGQKDEAASAADQAPASPPAAAPAEVNVTVNGTLTADQLKAAHAKLDEAASAAQ